MAGGNLGDVRTPDTFPSLLTSPQERHLSGLGPCSATSVRRNQILAGFRGTLGSLRSRSISSSFRSYSDCGTADLPPSACIAPVAGQVRLDMDQRNRACACPVATVTEIAQGPNHQCPGGSLGRARTLGLRRHYCCDVGQPVLVHSRCLSYVASTTIVSTLIQPRAMSVGLTSIETAPGNVRPTTTRSRIGAAVWYGVAAVSVSVAGLAVLRTVEQAGDCRNRRAQHACRIWPREQA
jgi:hypothetical protein